MTGGGPTVTNPVRSRILAPILIPVAIVLVMGGFVGGVGDLYVEPGIDRGAVSVCPA